jgi:hypothetical protein
MFLVRGHLVDIDGGQLCACQARGGEDALDHGALALAELVDVVGHGCHSLLHDLVLSAGFWV